MKRPSYSSEFKRETVKYILEHGLSISAASEKFGVGQSALRRWVVGWLNTVKIRVKLFLAMGVYVPMKKKSEN